MAERRFQKLLKLAYASIAILLVAVVTLSFLLGSKSNFNKNVCTTKACIKAANMILQNMDPTVDPCEHFYEFTCGTYIKNKRVPDEQSKIDIFDDLRDNLAYNIADLLAKPIDKNDIEATEKAKKLYLSCMNEANIEKQGDTKFLAFLKSELGGWPILEDGAAALSISSSMSSIDRLIKLRFLDIRPFFDLFISSNPKDPYQSIIRIKQPSWLFTKELYTDDKIVSSYKNFMLKYIQLLHSKNKNLKQDVDKMFDIEKELGFAQLDDDVRRNSTFRNMTIRELQRELPQFDWKKYIYSLFKDIENVTITENEILLIDDWKYLEKAIKLYAVVSKSNKKDLDNLLIWTLAKDSTTYLPKKFKEVKLDMDKIVKGTVSMPTRSWVCANFVLDNMEYAVGRMYVSNYFNSESKKAATEMILNIQNEFKLNLKKVDWMDAESKKAALDKLDLIDIKIGYPEFTYNDTHMDNLYKDYYFNEFEYFENGINILRSDSSELFRDIRKKRDRKMWLSGPAIVNAFYSPPANQICFPAGILQSPFYDSQAPNYLNYGGIGSVIGHEITHGFDDRGRLFDKNGIFYPDGSIGLWTNKTIQNYKKKVQCIIDQYNSYSSKQVNRSINGIQTQGENIADNGGVKQAYQAYQRWVEKQGNKEPLLPGLNFNQDQLFFINYGQVWCGKYRDQVLKSRILSGQHSPGEFRITGPTSNFEEFGKVFNCKPGQRNNPVKKCSVW